MMKATCGVANNVQMEEEDDPAVEIVSKPATMEKSTAEGDDDASDTELDQLLDQSLGEFGKHIPNLSAPSPNQPAQSSEATPCDSSSQPTKTTPPSAAKPPPPSFFDGPGDMDEMLTPEFVAEAEAQLGEAMKMLSSENPELWQQFETFAKSMGLEDPGVGTVPPPASGPASKGESSVDTTATATQEEKPPKKDEKAGQGQSASGGGSGGTKSTLDQKLEDTIRRMQDNAARLGPESNQMEGLEEMLNQLDVGSEEGEDHFMKMMQGMMSTLLSKEVLYPSLVDLCKQYPDWLSSHRGDVSPEDFQRYSKQLEVMKAICVEFEKEGAESTQASSDKILQLMQQLQQYGQPPEDLAGDNAQQAGIPPGLQNLLSGSGDSQNCTIM